MNNFTFEETNLLCIYNTGSRTGLIDALTEMRGELSLEEAEVNCHPIFLRILKGG